MTGRKGDKRIVATQKVKRALDCGCVRLEMLPMLTFWRADFTAFSKTLYESEAVAIVTLRGRGNSQQFLGMIKRVNEKPV